MARLLAAVSAVVLCCAGLAARANPWCVPPEDSATTPNGTKICKPGSGARCR